MIFKDINLSSLKISNINPLSGFFSTIFLISEKSIILVSLILIITSPDFKPVVRNAMVWSC